METLTAEQVDAGLADLDGWSHRDGAIARSYTFETFMSAIGFVNRIAEHAQAADHHPDMTISYTRVDVSVSTHSAGGVTQKDLDLAHQIEHLFAS